MTVVQVTGTATKSKIQRNAAGSRTEATVTEPYVPVGSKKLKVDKSGLYQVGDMIVLKKPVSDAFIAAIGMDKIKDCTPPKPGRKCTQWAASGYNIDYERQVVATDGAFEITLDAPLVDSLDAGVGGGVSGTLYAARERRIQHVGVEELMIDSVYDATKVLHNVVKYGKTIPAIYTDEAHAWNGIKIDKAVNSWVSAVSCTHIGFACVNLQKGSKRITVLDSTSREPVSVLTGGRRYPFNGDGQLNLFTRCTSDLGRHSFVSGGRIPGPNVFHRCTSTKDQADIGPHMRWSTGQLYDNVVGGQMRVWDRGLMGSGHGWSGQTIVFWNCESKESLGGSAGFTVDSPALGANYCVGCVSEVNSYTGGSTKGPWCCGASGSYTHSGTKDPIESLYEAQFDERTAHFAPAQPAAQPSAEDAESHAEEHAEEASGSGEEDDDEEHEEEPEEGDAAHEEEPEDEEDEADEDAPADDGMNSKPDDGGKRAAAILLSNHSAARFGRAERLLTLEHGAIQPQPLS